MAAMISFLVSSGKMRRTIAMMAKAIASVVASPWMNREFCLLRRPQNCSEYRSSSKEIPSVRKGSWKNVLNKVARESIAGMYITSFCSGDVYGSK